MRWIAVVVVIGAWFAFALYWGANGLARTLPFWGPPLVPLAACTYALLAYGFVAPFRKALLGVGVGGLALLEGVRVFAGGEVLWAYAQGRLPGDFAIPNGIATAVIGCGFLVIGLLWRAEKVSVRQRGALVAFNWLAIIQALGIIGHVGFLIVSGRSAELRSFPDLPLNFLPTFAVPFEIFINFVMIHALSRDGRETHRAALPVD